ncbi:hypothetical protein WJX73_002809 [Symbiochloris irregularis]|uniref:Uncharacterized protein n=1 Tax=Symbiochloris irregularis TaxID=706552 RepID=A0AAW1P891_9CHLO
MAASHTHPAVKKSRPPLPEPDPQTLSQPYTWFRSSAEMGTHLVLQAYILDQPSRADLNTMKVRGKLALKDFWLKSGASKLTMLVIKRDSSGRLYVHKSKSCQLQSDCRRFVVEVLCLEAEGQPLKPTTLQVYTSQNMKDAGVSQSADHKGACYRKGGADMILAGIAACYQENDVITWKGPIWKDKLEGWFRESCQEYVAAEQVGRDGTTLQDVQPANSNAGMPQQGVGTGMPPASSNAEPGAARRPAASQLPTSIWTGSGSVLREAGTLRPQRRPQGGQQWLAGRSTLEIERAPSPEPRGTPAHDSGADQGGGATPEDGARRARARARATSTVPEARSSPVTTHAKSHAAKQTASTARRILPLLSVAVLLLGVCWGGYAGYQTYTGLKEQVKELGHANQLQHAALQNLTATNLQNLTAERQGHGTELRQLKGGYEAKLAAARQHNSTLAAELSAAGHALDAQQMQLQAADSRSDTLQAALDAAKQQLAVLQEEKAQALKKPVGCWQHAQALAVAGFGLCQSTVAGYMTLPGILKVVIGMGCLCVCCVSYADRCCASALRKDEAQKPLQLLTKQVQVLQLHEDMLWKQRHMLCEQLDSEQDSMGSANISFADKTKQLDAALSTEKERAMCWQARAANLVQYAESVQDTATRKEKQMADQAAKWCLEEYEVRLAQAREAEEKYKNLKAGLLRSGNYQAARRYKTPEGTRQDSETGRLQPPGDPSLASLAHVPSFSWSCCVGVVQQQQRLIGSTSLADGESGVPLKVMKGHELRSHSSQQQSCFQVCTQYIAVPLQALQGIIGAA